MTKKQYEAERKKFWLESLRPDGHEILVERDIAAAEAAGVVWEEEEEEIELPSKVFYRGGMIASFCEESPVSLTNRHIYANINQTAFAVSPKPSAAAIHAICATYNAWGPEGTLRKKAIVGRQMAEARAIYDHSGFRRIFDELLAEPWKA